MTLREALASRRSVREFASGPVTRQELSDLLWAAQGVTHPEGFRTAPSAGALYPLEIYVSGAQGTYAYDAHRHVLTRRSATDARGSLCEAALRQESLLEAPITIAIIGNDERPTRKYGKRGVRYACLEAGHAAQNVLLQAVALGLAALAVGAFDDDRVIAVLELSGSRYPLCLIPVGHARTGFWRSSTPRSQTP